MSEYLLKNSTGSTIEVADIGLVIEDGQEIPIDENDFDGYLTPDMESALGATPSTGLVLETPSSIDLPKEIALERLSMGTQWKPDVAVFANLPTIGNEDGDIRLVRDESILYRWSQSALSWSGITSTFNLTVEEIDSDPSGDTINKLVFVDSEDSVYIDSATAYIGAPTAPLGLSSSDLIISGTTIVSGGLSQSNINYKSGDGAGAIIDYIVKDGTFTLTTENSNRLNYGDKGTLSVWFNGNEIVTIDLGANFNVANEETSQDILEYDVQGTGDSVTNGFANFTGPYAGKGYLEIVSVQAFNGFKFYQLVVAKAVITDSSMLRQGWNYFYMTHDGLTSYGGDQTSNQFDVFYDSDSGADPSASVPLITEKVATFGWLSGIKSYGTGATWDVDITGYDCFDNVYHSSEAPLVLSNWPGLVTTEIRYDDSSVSGVSDPPDINESMGIIDWELSQSSNSGSENAIMTVEPRDPYGTYTSANSPSLGILIWSWGSSSTDLIEYFNDEDYRLLDLSYDTVPPSITGQWDSTQSLVTYDGTIGLQVYQGELYFPSIDFSVKLPTGNIDYSVLESDSDKIYIRAFKDSSASHAHGTLRITGVNKTQLYDRDVKVWIKAPSITGWLDLTRDYNFPTFTGSDDDGCWVNRDSQNNSDFEFSIGQNYTELSGYMIIVKVEYPDSSSLMISHIEITDW